MVSIRDLKKKKKRPTPNLDTAVFKRPKQEIQYIIIEYRRR